MSLPAVLARGAEFAESTNGRNETDGAFRGKSASVVRSSVVRSILGLLPVPVTFVFQLALWHAIRPFALFLFVPAVYLSSWVGGFFVGIASTFAAAALAFYFFIRPERAWVVSGTGHSVVLALFVALGVVMSAFHLRFKRANQALAQALESGRRGNMLLRRANEEVSRLYEQTKHSDELRAQIFAGVTHELRTPLTLVLGPAERLCIAPGLDTAFRKEAELIARNARTLLHYVDDLIEVTKLEAGSVAPEYAESDVARISRFVASFFEVAARAKHMSFVLDVPPSLRAEVDPERLERVLLNILSNAFKFTPEHGRVRFGLREDEAHERIVFEVADSGPGIPVDKRQAVFDAYVQLEGRTSRRFAGTGLGLTIARELVELQRGHIEISDAPEGGTLFRVDLPLRASPGTRVEPSDDRSGVGMAEARSLAEEVRPLPCVPEALSGRSDAPIVLVVEDNPDMNEVLCECLRSDFRVARAFDGKEALRSALELAPDLVITDVMMPEMNGEELVRAMRARPELAATPIIVLTAVADEEARVRFLREGARDYVTKPFRMEELRARATSAIADRRAEQEIRRLSARIEAVSRASMSVYEAVAARPKHSVDAVLQTVASQAQILTAAKYVAAGLGTDPEQPFTSWCVVGMSREQGAAIGQRPLVGVLAQVAREGHALRLHDLTTHPEHFALPPGHPEMKSFLGVPIRYRDRVIGYLYLANKQGADEFTQADQSAVQMLADRAGGALETAHRYQAEGTERAWLEAVVEGLPDAAIVLDSAGHLASLNRVASALRRPDDGRRDPLGNPIPLELRRPNGEIVPPGELPYVRAFSRGESVLDVELEIQKPDGELLPVSARAVTVLGPDGKPTGATAVFRDVSAQKEVERMREEWMAIVAHDLRQPVGVISLATDLVRRAHSGPLADIEAKQLERIQRASRTLKEMIDELLDVSRLESCQLAIAPTQLDVVATAREVCQRMGGSHRGHQLVSVHESGARHVAWADPGRVEQIIGNLVSNACKYGACGTEVRVDVEGRDSEVEITVTNRGEGISAADMPLLFRRFGRGRGTRGQGMEGIGLGLYICKGLVEAHGGRIWVESIPGETTTFHFTLPTSGGGGGLIGSLESSSTP